MTPVVSCLLTSLWLLVRVWFSFSVDRCDSSDTGCNFTVFSLVLWFISPCLMSCMWLVDDLSSYSCRTQPLTLYRSTYWQHFHPRFGVTWTTMDWNFVANVESVWMHLVELSFGKFWLSYFQASQNIWILQTLFCFVNNLNLLLLSWSFLLVSLSAYSYSSHL